MKSNLLKSTEKLEQGIIKARSLRSHSKPKEVSETNSQYLQLAETIKDKQKQIKILKRKIREINDTLRTTYDVDNIVQLENQLGKLMQ